MKCFTFFEGQLVKGLTVTKSSNHGRDLVYIGKKGYNCRYETIFFGLKKYEKPEVAKDGVLYFAKPKIVSIKRDGGNGEVSEIEKLILVKSKFPDKTKVLLRINTSPISEINTDGSWKTIVGWPEQVVKGYGEGNGVRWVDELIVLDDEDVIVVSPAGGRRSDRKVIMNYCSELVMMPESEYLQKIESYKESIRLGIEENSKEESESASEENFEAKSLEPVVIKDQSKQNQPSERKKDFNKKQVKEKEVVIHIEEDHKSFVAKLPEFVD